MGNMIKDEVLESIFEIDHLQHQGIYSKYGLAFSTDSAIVIARKLRDGEPEKFNADDAPDVKHLLADIDFSECLNTLPRKEIKECPCGGYKICCCCGATGRVVASCGCEHECPHCDGMGYTMDNPTCGCFGTGFNPPYIYFVNKKFQSKYYQFIQSLKDVKVGYQEPYLLFTSGDYFGALMPLASHKSTKGDMGEDFNETHISVIGWCGLRNYTGIGKAEANVIERRLRGIANKEDIKVQIDLVEDYGDMCIFPIEIMEKHFYKIVFDAIPYFYDLNPEATE